MTFNNHPAHLQPERERERERERDSGGGAGETSHAASDRAEKLVGLELANVARSYQARRKAAL